MAQTKPYDVERPVAPPDQSLASWYAPGASDGLGDRLLMFDNSSAPSLELLRFRADLSDAPGFEASLREQVQRLARFQHPAFARVRAVQRLEPDGDLALISHYTPGKRLSEVLHRARGPAFATALIRQLAPALAHLQQQHPGAAHGILSPERIVVSPDARLTIVEHVVGPALSALQLGPLQLASMGVALPPIRGGAAPGLDAESDWYQFGLVALAVLIGRPVGASDQAQLEALLDGLSESARREGAPLSPFIRRWLDRTLQIAGGRIDSAATAQDALDELLHDEEPPQPRRVVPMRLAAAAAPPPSPMPAAVVAPPVRTVLEAPAAVATISPPPPVLSPREEPPVQTVLRSFPSQALVEPVAKPPVAAASEAVPASRVLEAFPRESVDRARTRQAPLPPSTPASLFEFHAPAPARSPAPAAIRPAGGSRLSPYEQEVLAAGGLLNLPGAAAELDRVADHTSPARRRIAPALVGALVACVAVEAGVIAWLARSLWVAPVPALVVAASPAGEQVVADTRVATVPPLGITVAPDLRWVRVTSPTGRFVSGKGGDSATGTLRISSPIAVKVLAGTRSLGSVPGPDLKVPAGRQQITLVNEALGYRVQQSVEFEGGQLMTLHVAPPPGTATIEASPAADVSINGQPAGRTPLGPLSLTPGEYEIAFKASNGKTDRQRVTIKADAATQVVGKPR